jgi:hypothetical protein
MKSYLEAEHSDFVFNFLISNNYKQESIELIVPLKFYSKKQDSTIHVDFYLLTEDYFLDLFMIFTKDCKLILLYKDLKGLPINQKFDVDIIDEIKMYGSKKSLSDSGTKITFNENIELTFLEPEGKYFKTINSKVFYSKRATEVRRYDIFPLKFDFIDHTFSIIDKIEELVNKCKYF